MVPEESIDADSSQPSAKAHPILFWILAALLFALYFALAFFNWNQNIPLFLALFFLSFSLYGLCVFGLFRNRFRGISFLWILLSAICFRLVLLGTEPSLSEDFFRYRWDGVVQMSGHSPYEYPPQAKELEPLRDNHYEKINHKNFKTPYPPAAEIFYFLFALLSSTPWIFKSFFALFDILLCVVLGKILIHEQQNPAWLLIYAWHPLPIIEFAGSGHMDILGIFFLFLAWMLLNMRQPLASGASFALALLVKYLPLFTLPWMFRSGKFRWIGAALIVSGLLMLPYYSPDLNMFSGALMYYKKWRFNDSLFGIFYDLLGGAEPARITGAICTFLTIGFCLWKKLSFYRSALIIFGVVILFSPVVHPWYLCWIIPFLVFHPNRAWLFLSGWIVLAYLIRYYFPVGVWRPLLWLKLLIYVPFYLYLLGDALKRKTVQTVP